MHLLAIVAINKLAFDLFKPFPFHFTSVDCISLPTQTREHNSALFLGLLESFSNFYDRAVLTYESRRFIVSS